MAEMSRDAEIKGIWTRYGWFYRLLRGAVLIGVGMLVGMLIYAEPQVRAEYVMNLFVTALSLGATALIFDELNRKRSEDDLRRQLVDDAASISNETAKNAVHQLWRRGWLHGETGLLKGENLTSANLQGAVLMRANLQGADLRTANLQKANLSGANLRNTNLQSADLQEANLLGAYLQGADLTNANLRGIITVINANFVLVSVSVMQPEMDESTILPDGNHWTPNTDMGQFVNPEHPNFWRSDIPFSPAYRQRDSAMFELG